MIYSSAQLVVPSPVTGLTIDNAGSSSTSVFYRCTLSSTHSAYFVAALTADVTLLTVPPRSRVWGVMADTTTAWAGLSGTIAFTVGKTAGGAEYIASHDVKSGVVTKGLADADMGTALTRAAAIQGGDIPSWSTTTNVQCRLTSGTGNIGGGSSTNLTNGVTTFIIGVEIYP